MAGGQIICRYSILTCASTYLFLLSLLSPVAILESKVFRCNDCGREFELDYQLQIHIDNFHKSVIPFKCEKCSQEFGLKEQLDMHLLNYTHDQNDIGKKDYRTTAAGEQSRKLY